MNKSKFRHVFEKKMNENFFKKKFEFENQNHDLFSENTRSRFNESNLR